MRGCSSGGELAESSVGPQVERWMMCGEVEGDMRGKRGAVLLIGPEGLIEIDVVSGQSRADVNRSDLLSVTTWLQWDYLERDIIEVFCLCFCRQCVIFEEWSWFATVLIVKNKICKQKKNTEIVLVLQNVTVIHDLCNSLTELFTPGF